jgi:tripartite-type tricarboxylate transporter receptor subunit TctC
LTAETRARTTRRPERRTALRLALAAGLAVAAGPVLAQAWPSRTITLIVPFAAGGGTDAFARPLAQNLDNQLGQRVIVDNRAGAGGTAGAAAAAKAAPDGYTFFVGATHHAIAPAIYPKLTYDLEKDFVPIGMVSQAPHVVVVNPQKVQAKTLPELVAYLKANPDKLTYASAGVGTTHHLAGELFKLLTGTKIVHVPYRGAGPAMQDLVAGQVDMAFDGLGSSSGQISGGQIKALAVASNARNKAFPDLPTAKEGGVDRYDVATWYALWAPKGTPPEVVERMTKALQAAFQAPDIRAAWERNGSELPTLTGAAFGSFVNSEIARWGKVVADAGVKVD